MKAIGLTCGIGSMLIGARQAGFNIEGNIEWRKYYHAIDDEGRNTYTENFPNSVLTKHIDHLSSDEIERLMNVELALGHPECGAYSALSGANKNYQERQNSDPSDIPLFIGLVKKLQPQFFVMDNLPKSLNAVPIEQYANELPNYDLFPEWVSNYGYGNTQKERNRFFMIGSLKDHKYAFQPGEFPHHTTVADVIGDMGAPGASNVPNHDMCALDEDSPRAFNLNGYGRKNTWADAKEHFKNKPAGYTMKYTSKEGREVTRIGFMKGKWEGPANVLTGGNATIHNIRNEPYTIRERARIQGFPDDFIFYGTKFNKLGQWNHNTNPHMVKQTGKAMPIEFCRYVSVQIAAHIQKSSYETTNRRILTDYPGINSAKTWYCENIGYANQEQACNSCWLKEDCTLPRKI
jgi:DNA (cytosine-5)-methyltransferase 1